MFNLPPHLQTLNSISTSPPSSALTQQEEEAFWGFMHTDDLFSNFGVAPSELEDKEVEQQQQPAVAVAETPLSLATAGPPPTPASALDSLPSSEDKRNPSTPASTPLSATTLESFLAAFANDPSQIAGPSAAAGTSTANTNNNNYLLNLGLPFSTATSTAPTPAAGINTADLLASYADSPYDFSTEEGRISGAKRLKQVGAGQAEIEEDKRRRNTEASARFRAKKKEREQAVEKRAKDLEAQVAQLAADKASLENENRLLKAIVLNGSGGQADALQSALSSFGKRKREA